MHLQPSDVAVVTGAASGIGYALTEQLLSRGLTVVMADVEQPALQAAATRLAAPGRQLLAHVTDVADGGAMDELAAATLDTFGAVHLVCNNAGVTGAGGPMWTLHPSDWRWALEVNLWGVINGIRSFVPHLVAQDRGHVLNTASLAGLTSTPYTGPYNASKHAVVALTETLAAEFAMRGSKVKASVACPSFVTTRIWDAERNRPGDLSHETAPADPSYERFAEAISQLAANGQDPSTTAQAILTGVERDALHILTHPEMAPLVEERLQLLRAAITQ